MNQQDRSELKEMLDLTIRPITNLLNEHHKTLFGDGNEGNQGLRVDMDRVKQEKKRDDKHFAVIYSGIVGLSLKAAWEWIASRVVH